MFVWKFNFSVTAHWRQCSQIRVEIGNWTSDLRTLSKNSVRVEKYCLVRRTVVSSRSLGRVEARKERERKGGREEESSGNVQPRKNACRKSGMREGRKRNGGIIGWTYVAERCTARVILLVQRRVKRRREVDVAKVRQRSCVVPYRDLLSGRLGARVYATEEMDNRFGTRYESGNSNDRNLLGIN